MKKLLIFLIILAIGLFYLDQKTHWITNRTHDIKDVTNPSTIVLHKMEVQEHVYDFYVHVKGYIDGSAKLAFSYDSKNKKPYRHEFISGEVDVKWEGNWYADTLIVDYTPSTVTSGELSITYDFHGL